MKRIMFIQQLDWALWHAVNSEWKTNRKGKNEKKNCSSIWMEWVSQYQQWNKEKFDRNWVVASPQLKQCTIWMLNNMWYFAHVCAMAMSDMCNYLCSLPLGSSSHAYRGTRIQNQSIIIICIINVIAFTQTTPPWWRRKKATKFKLLLHEPVWIVECVFALLHTYRPSPSHSVAQQFRMYVWIWRVDSLHAHRITAAADLINGLSLVTIPDEH